MARPKRKVTFKDDIAQIVCEIVNREDMSEEHSHELWFTRSDYHFSRAAARMASEDSERLGSSNRLDVVFHEKCEESQEILNQWVEQGQGTRGLERWANSRLGKMRQQAQFNTIMDVLSAQQDMLALKKGVDADALRKVSAKGSKVARHFARMMGKADAYAAASSLSFCKVEIIPHKRTENSDKLMKKESKKRLEKEELHRIPRIA